MPGTVIVANLGTPAAPDEAAVRAFLAEFLSDPAVVDYPRWFWIPLLRGVILRRRPARVAELYRNIWTPEGSPLDVDTRRIAAALGARLGTPWHVAIAYRYGAPALPDVLRRAFEKGTGDVVMIPLFPQRTDATTGTLARLAERVAASCRASSRLRIAIPEPDTAGYVDALAAKTRDALSSVSTPIEHLVVSYHGIPVRYARRERGVYEADCARTTEALAQRLGWPRERLTLSYQSTFGPERWLLPATATVLEELPARGLRSVAVATPGFVTDGLETIEEIGLRGRESFEHAGGTTFIRVAAPADHPALIDALASLALRA